MVEMNVKARQLTMIILLFVAVLLVFLPAQAVAQDVIGIPGANRTGVPNGFVILPIFVRDITGTPAGRDLAAARQISEINFRIVASDPTKIAGCNADPANCAFREAGLTRNIRPDAGTDPCATVASGCFVRVETKTANAFTLTLAARSPLVTTADPVANLVGFVRVKLASNFSGNVSFTLDPPGGFLGGTDNASAETTANGALSLNNTLAQRGILDVDASGAINPFADGILVIRRMLTASGTQLTANAVEGARSSATDLEQFLDSLGLLVDVDGNGTVNPFADGILIIRFMLTATGAQLIANAVEPNCTRCTAADIEAYLAELTQN